MVCQYFFND
ncbi:unnamed protein product [Acanthoscelides obtectus]|uniref:Uncharacterized protein n=1 Tax=Acanthoscelides obtectus TaxID=200917 RepID=A0A9P0MGS1_ACAOB|nr:unnamed protein product [Acanthoscelides obtectus]CAK1629819.1 hypothetical protein AOBTE_LOCUS5975 [Acanthoscelides obtectus]